MLTTSSTYIQLKTTQTKTPTRVRVAFNDDHTKKEAMKAKKRLKGQNDLWLSDELTQYMSKLAYLARFSASKRGTHYQNLDIRQ